MSDTSAVMTARQAAELDHAFARHGWTPEEVKILSSGDNLAAVRQVILNRAKIEGVKHLVDLDAAPFCPDDWSVEEHRKGGQFEFDPTKIKFWLSESQKKGSHRGHDLREELKSQSVFNANLLDFLLKPENQYLIPEEWKGKAIFFWGTIYRNAGGYLYVRFLYWDGSRWHWSNDWLGRGWGADVPAAVLASN